MDNVTYFAHDKWLREKKNEFTKKNIYKIYVYIIIRSNITIFNQ